MTEMTEELARRVCSGDESAYEEFVRKQWPHAVRTCWLILRNTHDAEEAAQDAFVNVYKHRRDLQDAQKFNAWFYRILMNAAKQRRRSRKWFTLFKQEDTMADTSDRMADTDLKLSIQAAMESLAAEERMAVVLCYYCGLTDREAASSVDWTLGTYKWRLAKARKRLGTLLEELNPKLQAKNIL